MRKTFASIMHDAMHKKRPRVKAYVRVRAVWQRDKRGRFMRLLRKAHTRKIMDWKAPWATGMELLAENVTANNALLQSLMKKGAIHAH